MKYTTALAWIMLVAIFLLAILGLTEAYAISRLGKQVQDEKQWIHDICWSMNADGYSDPCKKILTDIN